MLLLLSYGVIVATVALLFTPTPASSMDSECQDIVIIFAHGSGSNLEDAEVDRFNGQLVKKLPTELISYQSYELGSRVYNSHQYQAVSVKDAGNLIGAVFSQGSANDYGDSVKGGVLELQGYLSERIARCPTTKFILGGYSQGAQVIGQALEGIPRQTRDKIILASLFGDPKLYLPEGWGVWPKACSDADSDSLSPWRRDIGNCRTSEGRLRARIPYVPEDMKNKVGTWCEKNDIVCGSSTLSNSGHNLYANNDGMIDKASEEAVAKMSRHFSLNNLLGSNQTIDIGHIRDSNCHMAGVIDGGGDKSKIDAFYNQLLDVVHQSNGRIALVNHAEVSETRSYAPYSTQVTDAAIQQARSFDSWRANAKQVFITTYHCYHTLIDGAPQYGIETPTYENRRLHINLMSENLADPISHRVINIDINRSSPASIVQQMNAALSQPSVQARVSSSHAQAPPNTPVYFDASQSLTYGDDQIISYQWDFNGDERIDMISSSPYAQRSYTQNEYLSVTSVTVRVVTAGGSVSAATIPMDIHEQYALEKSPETPQAPVTLSHKKMSDSSVNVSWQPKDNLAYTWQIMSDDTILGNTISSQTSATITDFDFSKSARITVTGRLPDGTIGQSTTITIPAAITTPPPAPQKPLTWLEIWQLITKLLRKIFG